MSQEQTLQTEHDHLAPLSDQHDAAVAEQHDQAAMEAAVQGTIDAMRYQLGRAHLETAHDDDPHTDVARRSEPARLFDPEHGKLIDVRLAADTDGNPVYRAREVFVGFDPPDNDGLWSIGIDARTGQIVEGSADDPAALEERNGTLLGAQLVDRRTFATAREVFNSKDGRAKAELRSNLDGQVAASDRAEVEGGVTVLTDGRSAEDLFGKTTRRHRVRTVVAAAVLGTMLTGVGAGAMRMTSDDSGREGPRTPDGQETTLVQEGDGDHLDSPSVIRYENGGDDMPPVGTVEEFTIPPVNRPVPSSHGRPDTMIPGVDDRIIGAP